MRILLAGGAGFLGSHLAEELVARGDYVVILDNLSSRNFAFDLSAMLIRLSVPKAFDLATSTGKLSHSFLLALLARFKTRSNVSSVL